MEKPYQNREIDDKLRTLSVSQEEMHEENQKVLGKILEQTIKTNGRVTKLEKNLLIVACVLGTALALKSKELFEVIKTFLL